MKGVFELLSTLVASIGGQMDPSAVPEPGGAFSVLGSAVGAFLTALAVGAILIAVAPDYTRERMADVLEDPVGSFLYGLVSLLLLFFVLFVLAITVIGLVLAVPLALLAYLAWAVGAAIAFLAIGDRLVGHDDGWAKPLVVGAAINGGLTLTGVGGLLTFAIGAAGFGTVLRGYLS
jgi:hypothetical protein